jgi:hypothetical protein
MDLRKELTRDFSGQELVYSDIDGGEAWGRRKQVKLLIMENGIPEYSIETIQSMILKASQ